MLEDEDEEDQLERPRDSGQVPTYVRASEDPLEYTIHEETRHQNFEVSKEIQAAHTYYHEEANMSYASPQTRSSVSPKKKKVTKGKKNPTKSAVPKGSYYIAPLVSETIRNMPVDIKTSPAKKMSPSPRKVQSAIPNFR